MLKTRDKALISLTALFQAALGIFGFFAYACEERDIFVMKMIFRHWCGRSSCCLSLHSHLRS